MIIFHHQQNAYSATFEVFLLLAIRTQDGPAHRALGPLRPAPDQLLFQRVEHLLDILVFLRAGQEMAVSLIMLFDQIAAHLQRLVAFAAHDEDEGIGSHLLDLVVVVGDFVEGADRGDVVGDDAGVTAAVEGGGDSSIEILAGCIVVGEFGPLVLDGVVVDPDGGDSLVIISAIFIANEQFGFADLGFAHYDHFVVGELLPVLRLLLQFAHINHLSIIMLWQNLQFTHRIARSQHTLLPTSQLCFFNPIYSIQQSSQHRRLVISQNSLTMSNPHIQPSAHSSHSTSSHPHSFTPTTRARAKQNNPLFHSALPNLRTLPKRNSSLHENYPPSPQLKHHPKSNFSSISPLNPRPVQQQPSFLLKRKNTLVEKSSNRAEEETYEPYPTLSLDDFQIGELLGKGAEATVKLVLHKATGAVFSLRTISRKKATANLPKFIQALKLQMFINHPYITKVYGLIVEANHVHMIMEYCHDGNLSQNVQDYKGESLETKQLLRNLAKGVQFLHEQRVQHRDLKLENILMNYGVPKISDFELSVHVKLAFLHRKTICGSPVYFSPEMIANNRYNRKADIWCLGIVFYEILCGYFPFDFKDEEDFAQITEGNIKALPPNLSKSAHDLLWAMLEVDSDERLDANAVLEHPFLAETESEGI